MPLFTMVILPPLVFMALVAVLQWMFNYSPAKIGTIFAVVLILLFGALVFNAEVLSPESEGAVWMIVIPLLPAFMLFPRLEYMVSDSVAILLVTVGISSLVLFAFGWILASGVVFLRRKFSKNQP